MNKFLYEPINQLKPLAEDIYICDGDVIHMDFKVCTFPFSTRMVIIKLKNGELFVHSPIKLNNEIINQLKHLGDVRYIVAPNKIHYAYVQEWSDYYPEASVYGVDGIAKRAKEQNIAVEIEHILTEDSFSFLQDELDYCLFKGSSFMDEAVFLHKKSKTLIVVDLIENFEKEKLGPITYLMAKLAGVTAPKGKAPKDLRFTFRKGMAQAIKSHGVIKNWEFDKIVMAHGKIVTENAKEFFANSFNWVK